MDEGGICRFEEDACGRASLRALVLKREQPRLRRERDRVALHSHRPELYHAVVVGQRPRAPQLLGQPSRRHFASVAHATRWRKPSLCTRQPRPAAHLASHGFQHAHDKLAMVRSLHRGEHERCDKEAGQNGVFLLAHHAHHTGANAEELVVSCLTTADVCQNTRKKKQLRPRRSRTFYCLNLVLFSRGRRIFSRGRRACAAYECFTYLQRVSAAGPNAHSLSFVRARRARALNGCVPPPPRASAALRVSAPAPSWAARRRHRRARRRRSRRLACSSRRPSPSAC